MARFLSRKPPLPLARWMAPRTAHCVTAANITSSSMTSTTASSTTASNNLPPEDLKTTPRSTITFGPLAVARVIVNLFSTNLNTRNPPSPGKTHSIRLITIGVSHYCEKVRWGLDLVESEQENPIYYTEDAHPPPFCSFATLPVSNSKASATPMIVDSEDTTASYMNLSNVILQQYCPFLYPEPIREEIVKMEADLGKHLGPAVRCYAYQYLLQPDCHEACIKICTAQTSKVEAILFEKMLDKGVSQAMRKIIKVNDTTAAASKQEILEVFDEVSKRLESNGGKYLMDTKQTSYGFTAADVTFAALSYPLVRPPEMSNFTIMDDSLLPPELVAIGEQLKETTAGKHVLKMYKQNRIPTNYFESKPNDGLVIIKSTERDVNPLMKMLYSVGIMGAAVGSIVWYRNQ